MLSRLTRPSLSRFSRSAPSALYTDVPEDFDPKKSGLDNAYQDTLTTLDSGISGRFTPGLSYNLGASSASHSALTVFEANPQPNRFTNDYAATASITLQQALLRDFWIDAGRLRIAVNKTRLKISEQQLRLQIMQTVLAVQNAYLDLIGAREQVKVSATAVEEARQLLDFDNKLVAANELPPLGAKLSESRLESAQADLLTAQNNLDIARAALRNLLTEGVAQLGNEELDAGDPLAAEPVTVDRTGSLQKALTTRPDLQQAKLAAEQQGLEVKYRYNQMFPVLNLEGSYGGTAIDDARSSSFDSLANLDHPAYSVGVLLEASRWATSRRAANTTPARRSASNTPCGSGRSSCRSIRRWTRSSRPWTAPTSAWAWRARRGNTPRTR